MLTSKKILDIPKIGDSMKKLNKKTINTIVATIITIGINLILIGIIYYRERLTFVDSHGFTQYYKSTRIDEIFVLLFFISLFLMIVLGVSLIIKAKKEKSKLTCLIGLISIALSIGITIISTSQSISPPDRQEWHKPVLYLYPEKEEKITLTFKHPENLLTTYPKYETSWEVTANPDGSIYDKNNKYYYALYWDEKNTTQEIFTEGFYVTKENAIEFLETTLTQIGLTRREQNEFIMYWLPILEKNEKNLVNYTLTEERQKENKLMITPKPDSLLRIAINIKKVDKKVNIKEQVLPTFKREGFTAVEWGGTIYK